MSLNSYSALKTSLAGWLNRTDLTATIPDFITLAEAKMRRQIKARKQVQTTTLTLEAEVESYALPCGFDGVVALRIGTDRPAVYVSPDYLDDFNGTTTGKPERYTIVGDDLIVHPIPDGEYEAQLRYRKLFTSLSGAVATNWLLDKHPDAYLYGALMQAAPYLDDDQRIGTWASLYSAAISEINQQALEQQHGAHLETQVRTVI